MASRRRDWLPSITGGGPTADMLPCQLAPSSPRGGHFFFVKTSKKYTRVIEKKKKNEKPLCYRRVLVWIPRRPGELVIHEMSRTGCCFSERGLNKRLPTSGNDLLTFFFFSLSFGSLFCSSNRKICLAEQMSSKVAPRMTFPTLKFKDRYLTYVLIDCRILSAG